MVIVSSGNCSYGVGSSSDSFLPGVKYISRGLLVRLRCLRSADKTILDLRYGFDMGSGGSSVAIVVKVAVQWHRRPNLFLALPR